MNLRMLAKLEIGALVALCVTGSAIGQVLELSKVYEADANEYGDATYVQLIDVGKGVTVTARTELTRKGNGVLSVKNLELRIYDAHDDAAYFQDSFLKTEFADVDGDGFKDIVISGIVVYEITRVGEAKRFVREPVVFVYLYRAEGDAFKLGYKSASFDLESDSGPTQSPLYLDQGTWQTKR